MGIVAKSSGSDFPLPPEGSHLARCCQVIDQGHQVHEKYGTQHKVLIGWELSNVANEQDPGKLPFLVWNQYTMSLHERSWLCKHLVAWRGKAFTAQELDGFSLEALLNAPCILTIVHNEGYANVAGVAKVPAGTAVPELKHPVILFDIDRFDEPLMQQVFETFSEHHQGKILGSTELRDRNGSPEVMDPQQVHQPLTNDDIPF